MCPATYKSADAARRHKNTVHDPENKLEVWCAVCEIALRDTWCFNRHLKSRAHKLKDRNTVENIENDEPSEASETSEPLLFKPTNDSEVFALAEEN